MDKIRKFIYPTLIILIILGGVFARFWQLNIIPPGVHYDEAYNGVNAILANETGEYKIFYSDNTGREGFHINVIAFFISIFGNTNLGLRFANAMWGSLTLLGFFFLLRELKFSKISVVSGTFIMASSFWHIVFSRTAYRAIMVPLILVWAFYFFWKGMNCLEKEDEKKQKSKLTYFYFILSGLFLGLGFHTYIAFRVAPFIFLAVGLSFVLTKREIIKKHWKKIMTFLVAVLLISAPMIFYFTGNFQELVYRSDSVSIFNAPGMSFLGALKKSLLAHLDSFFIFGDHNPRHNYNDQPLLPHVWSVLFALGFFISIWEIVKIRSEKARKWLQVSVLAQSMFWIMLLPGVLSIEGIPHSLRIIGSMPAVYLMMVLALEYLLNLKEESTKFGGEFGKKLNLVIFGTVFLLVFGGFSQIDVYFSKWASDTRTEGAYERKLYNLGRLIKDLPVKKNNYLITAFNTTVYANHKQSSLKTVEYVGYPASSKYLFYKPLDALSEISCDDSQIVFLESDQWLRDQYKGFCPKMSTKRYSFDNGKYLFWVINQAEGVAENNNM